MSTIDTTSDKMRPKDTTTEILHQKNKPIANESELDIHEVVHAYSAHSPVETAGVIEALSLFDRLDNIDEHYAIGEQLVEGGSSKISTGKDLFLKRTVVIKSLRTELSADKERIKKFIQEARLLAQLDHPSIVPLYELTKDDAGGLHLAMKHIDGISAKNCFSRLRSKYRNMYVSKRVEKRALMARLELFLDVCSAIDYAHSRDIVHGDMKPGNIMFSSDGNVFVMDWSTANKVGEARSGYVSGTAFYTSLDEAAGKPVSVLDDVFSLGMILYEFATLRTGITGISLREVQEKIRNGEFEPVTHFSEPLKISPVLAAIIEKARNPDSATRYQSVKELAMDLRRFMFEGTASVVSENFIERLRRWVVKHKVFFATVVLVLIAGISTATSFIMETKYKNDTLRNNTARMLIETRNSATGVAWKINTVLNGLHRRILAMLSEFSTVSKAASGFQAKSIYMPEDFLPGGALESRTKHSEDFDQNIGIDLATAFIPNGISDVQAKNELRNSRGFAHLAFMTILSSSSECQKDSRPETSNQILDDYLKHGSVLRRISVITGNGICIRIPGMYEDLSREMIISDNLATEHAKNPMGFQWDFPTADPKGRIVIPFIASTPDMPEGSEISVVSEINMHMLMTPLRDLISEVSGSKHLIKAFVLTETGDIIYITDNRNGELQSSFSRMDGKPYLVQRCRDFALLGNIRRTPAGVPFPTHDNGADAIGIHFTIGPAKWKLVFLIEGMSHEDAKAMNSVVNWLFSSSSPLREGAYK